MYIVYNIAYVQRFKSDSDDYGLEICHKKE